MRSGERRRFRLPAKSREGMRVMRINTNTGFHALSGEREDDSGKETGVWKKDTNSIGQTHGYTYLKC